MVKSYRLGDGCSITHGFAFSGMVESADDSLPVVVNIGNFKYSGGFRFESTKIQRFDGDFPEKFRLEAGDVLLVMTCQTAGGEILGIPGRIPADGRVYLHNQRMGKVVINRPDELDLGYLYYLFLSPNFNAHLVATATGSKILHTAPARIENYVWPRPSLPIQRRIADILSAYDDLIENNTKRIKILEEMARSLYREWFVNFRFPGHEKVKMVSSPLGKVPEGWKVAKLGELVGVNERSIRRGAEPAFVEYVDISSVSPGRIEKSQRYAFADAPGRARRLVQDGDTIWSMVRPNHRAHAFVVRPSPDLVVSTGFAVITPKRLPTAFTYLAVSTDEFVAYLVNHARGAAYPAVTGEDFQSAPALLPNMQAVERFEALALPLLLQVDALQRQSAVLAQTRDLLLPRLISGEIAVDAADDDGSASRAHGKRSRVSERVTADSTP